ncbi:Serine/threonine-protein kinase PrkC [Planctomycetes bacterium CA13]|uniref:non-specific serine/threonine protein kinase n=1 Tax=Novipirellula herctigrandis TaxID=2527986 RepID=A0A5C5YXU0_9BACT|nr:Serine/threonine-protein kinase PrkC [Planctomycetes bacterium CA13]
MPQDDITEDLPQPLTEGSDDGRLVSAVKQYMKSLDDGSAPPLEEYLRQHADIAKELRPALEGLALVHRAGTPKPSSMVAPDAEFTAKPIGDFQIVGELGRGGMGVVYEAVQLSLGRHVALKVLPFASGLDEVRLQRFRNEAHAAAALHHTNIVPVYAVGSDRGVHYYAMQMIEGHTLAELIHNMREVNGKQSGDALQTPPVPLEPKTHNTAENPLGKKEDDTFGLQSTVLNTNQSQRTRYYQSVVRMAHQAAVALHHAHSYGVIHRDIKPANLLLDSSGKVWVTDFGLAQVHEAESQLTRTGDFVGTLRYMSPEQAAGDRAVMDHRTDIYSLGVTLYELLTLEPAIRGDSYREMLNQVAEHEPATPKLVDPSLPTELDTIVRKAIAKSSTERYANAAAFADDLQNWLDDRPIAARPPTTLERFAKWRRRNSGFVVATSVVLLLATIGLLATTLMVWHEQRQTRKALDRATEQRQLAEASFQQARSAVDTFSSLSESELAYRPELQDLRRSFLETSLEFYRDFLEQRSDEPQLANELAATSERVEEMVSDLRVLDNIAVLLLLSDKRVQREIQLAPENQNTIEEAIEKFRTARRTIAESSETSSDTSNAQMNDLVRSFDSFVTAKLAKDQFNRLRQISLQQRLPFTFKTSEIVTALGLTREQRDAINRIIVSTRPGRGGPPGFQGPSGPDDARRRGRDRPNMFGEFGPEGPPPDFLPGGNGLPPNGFGNRFVPGGRRSNELDHQHATNETVKQIIEILTPEQRSIWDGLVGEPFDFRFR